MKHRFLSFPILPAALVLIGFTSVIAQIVLLRELIVVFQGNEISLGVVLACWLFWTALGSGVLGRLRAFSREPGITVAWLEAAVAFILPLTILAVRAGRLPFHATPGEILGPGPTFLTSLAVLSLFCVTSGILFAAGSRLHATERRSTTATASGTVYLLEAVGSGLGGILASLFFIKYMSSPQIALLLSALNLAAAAGLCLRRSSRKTAAVMGLAAVLFMVIIPAGGRALESFSQRILWRGFEVVDSRNSVYGNLVVTSAENTKTFFTNGLAVLTVPDRAAAEEGVHYALLQHPSPGCLLLIGGGMNGGLAQAFQHPALGHADYVELDPMIIRLGREHLSRSELSFLDDPRVGIKNVDGRLFVKRTGRTYDVIVVNLPDPQTAQLNRLYTLEFFKDAARRLTPGGVFSFRVGGSENYISDELARFLRCLNKTLLSVFPEVLAFPGANVHFFAAKTEGTLTADPGVLLDRLRDRNISTAYIREYYLPFRLAPDRLHDLENNIRPYSYTPINKDYTPIAYYYGMTMWSTRFSDEYRGFLRRLEAVGFRNLTGAALLALFVVAAVLFFRRGGDYRIRASAGYCAAVMGFTIIGLEMLLLLAFQAVHGFVYHQLAILIAAFMAGMSAGGFISLRRPVSSPEKPPPERDSKSLLALQVLAAVSPLLLIALFRAAPGLSAPAGALLLSGVVFPAAAFILGGLGGFQFPVCSRIFYGAKTAHVSGPGAVYALDLAGACLGAVVISGFLVPLFGFYQTAVLLALTNLAPALLVFVTVVVSKPGTKG